MKRNEIRGCCRRFGMVPGQRKVAFADEFLWATVAKVVCGKMEDVDGAA
jgi:hypothetical protein